MESVTVLRYYQASAEDYRTLPIRTLRTRIHFFASVHATESKNRIILAGGKP